MSAPVLSFRVFARIIDDEIRARLIPNSGPLFDRNSSGNIAIWYTREAKVSIKAINDVEAEIVISTSQGNEAVNRFIERMDLDHANGLARDLAILFSGPGDDAD